MYKEVILFLTGKLAEKQLVKILEKMSIPSPCKKPPEWNYRVKQLGLSVAALMTGDLILRRLQDVKGINKVILPGRVRVDIDKLSKNYGIPFERGPEEIRDIPEFFGRSEKKKNYGKKLYIQVNLVFPYLTSIGAEKWKYVEILIPSFEMDLAHCAPPPQ